MFYRHIDNNNPAAIAANTAAGLLGSRLPGEAGFTFANSTAAPVQINYTNHMFTVGDIVEKVPEREWRKISGKKYTFMSPHMTCCAAVLFFMNNNQEMWALHAFGGNVSQDDLDECGDLTDNSVSGIIYALPKTIDANYAVNLTFLATVFNTDKICIVDGFDKNVFAAANGNIAFV